MTGSAGIAFEVKLETAEEKVWNSIPNHEEHQQTGSECSDNRYDQLQKDVAERIQKAHRWHVGEPLCDSRVIRRGPSEQASCSFLADVGD